jgi:hypothetical protein
MAFALMTDDVLKDARPPRLAPSPPATSLAGTLGLRERMSIAAELRELDSRSAI